MKETEGVRNGQVDVTDGATTRKQYRRNRHIIQNRADICVVFSKIRSSCGLLRIQLFQQLKN